MHHDAKRATIGVGVNRMGKRHMDSAQEHQQDQAHRDRYPQNALLGVEIAS